MSWPWPACKLRMSALLLQHLPMLFPRTRTNSACVCYTAACSHFEHEQRRQVREFHQTRIYVHEECMRAHAQQHTGGGQARDPLPQQPQACSTHACAWPRALHFSALAFQNCLLSHASLISFGAPHQPARKKSCQQAGAKHIPPDQKRGGSVQTQPAGALPCLAPACIHASHGGLLQPRAAVPQPCSGAQSFGVTF